MRGLLDDVEDFLAEGGVGDRPGWDLLVSTLSEELRCEEGVAMRGEVTVGRGG